MYGKECFLDRTTCAGTSLSQAILIHLVKITRIFVNLHVYISCVLQLYDGEEGQKISCLKSA